MDQGIVIYSTTWCGDCRRAKRVMDQLDVDYREVNIDVDETAAARVVQLNGGSRSVPTIVFPDGDILVEPSNAALTQKLVEAGFVTAHG
ncbi:MAG: NrdH-redoxin [Chloroflexales bacterium]|nr:NrdH-redoxin [Chloroflexales bacterium]